MHKRLCWKRVERLADAKGDEAARQAAMLRDEFGDDFASFLLRDKGKPSLREDMLVVLFARKEEMEAEPEHPLREALLLPLLWKEGEAHSRLLPPRLLEVADRVCADEEVAKLSGKSYDKTACWGLHPCFPVDISDWDMIAETWDSAWGILAAGLYLKREALRLKPGVLVSAAWDGKRIEAVNSVETKARAAERAGASLLFLSAHENDALRDLEDAPRFSIKYFPFNAELRYSFAELLYCLELPPELRDPENPDLEDVRRCREYASRLESVKLPGMPKKADEYEFRNVAPARALELRKNAKIGKTERLVVLVSQVSAARLSFLTFAPKHVLFLVSKRERDSMYEFFPEKSDNIRIVDIENPGETITTVTEYLKEKDVEGRIVVDVTGMPKSVTAGATIAAMAAGASIVTMQSRSDERGAGRVPGKEEIIWIKQ